ncbi:MAG TPA: universal stress protein [Acidimicrobiales bacterium]|nr:universal stress protein [Acidimicrobiales bacterium]
MTRIVVGVDGSEGSAEALRWAVEEGRLRQAPVVAVMAWGYLDQHHAVQGAEFDPGYGEPQAKEALAAAVEAAVGDAAADVEQVVVNDLAPAALRSVAADDDLLVVGARGLGGFKGLLLGSVSQRVLAEATCPVAVIRPGKVRSEGPVVVGVDASATARRALEWAAAEARARGARLRVVHAWSAPFVGGYPFGGATFDHRMVEEGARELLDGVVDSVDLSGLTVEKVLVYGTGGAALLEESPEAGVVVVGSRGLSGITRWLLGSVSHQVVHHAEGVVVVVPHE